MNDLSELIGKIFGLADTTPKSDEEMEANEKKLAEWRCKSMNAEVGHLNEKDGYNCALCLNRGYWFKPHKNGRLYDEIMVTCKCQTVRKSIALMEKSGLKSVVREYRFDNYEITEDWQKAMWTKARNFCDEEDGKWLFFGGSSGCGKTHLCTAVCTAFLRKNKAVKYMLWRDEAGRLKSLVNDEEYGDNIAEYKEVDVLYIDDLFKTGKSADRKFQMPTQGDINLAFEILNNRAMSGKTTIISTECTLPELIEIDEAIAGRIKQMSGDYCMSIAKDRNKNYRLR